MKPLPLALADFELEAACLECFRPPARLLPSEWAEANLILPSESNAQPGPLRLNAYQRGMADAVADPTAEIIVFQCASQTGKSTAIDVALTYAMANDPGPILHTSPTDQKARDFIRDRLDALINSTPALRSIIGSGGRGGAGDSVSRKVFPGGSLNVASSYKPDDLAARAIRWLFLDEVDRFAQSAGTEGDPVALAIKRTRTYRNRRIIISSTPTLKARSKISDWFLRGDQRRFFVPCHDCGTFDHIHFGRLKWEKGQPKSAHLVCDHCGAKANERQRLDMIDRGQWQPTAAESAEPGVVSYHLTELASTFSNLASVAAQYELADKSPDRMRVFMNTVLAEVYDSENEISLDAGELQQRAEPIRAPYPETISFVTAGVDVQGDRLELTYLAHLPDGSSAVLNHAKIMGDSSGPAVWNELDAALGVKFVLKDRRTLGIEAVAVDSGFNTSNVLAFVMAQRKKSRRVFATKGRAGFDQPIVREGSLSKGMLRVMIVGVDGAKLTVQKRLGLSPLEAGCIHLPDHLDREYFEGLASEQLRSRTVRGFNRFEYHKIARRNEALDCLVLATAIASLVKVKRKTNGALPAPGIAERVAKLHAASNSHGRLH